MGTGTDGAWARVVARRYHTHAPGLVYALLTVLLVFGAINTQNNLLFFMFGLAVCGIIVSGVLSGAALMGVRVRREVLGPAQAGGTLRIRYHITNRSLFVPAGALVIEELGRWKAGRHVSAWADLLGPVAASAAWVPARGSVVVETSTPARRRGLATFDAVRVSTTFPFGIALKSVVFSQPEGALVRPWVAPVRREVWRRVAGAGGSPGQRRKVRSLGGEFFSLREYASGDSVRAIAWRASARRGELLVREVGERGPRIVWLSPVLGSEPLARERVVSLAAGLARSAAGQGFEVGCMVGERTLPPATGERQAHRVLDWLAGLDDAGEGSPGVRVSVQGGGAVTLTPMDPACVPPGAWSAMPAPAVVGGPRRAWWRRWFGGGG